MTNDYRNNLPAAAAFNGRPMSIQAQSILYGNGVEDIERALVSIGRSAEIAKRAGCFSRLDVVLGDSSPTPCLSEAEVNDIQLRYGHQFHFRCDFFAENLGSARGHNRLSESATADFILIRNPDVILAPTLLRELIESFGRSGTGIVEAKQLPLEHPKAYDLSTGETSWASTACALTPAALFRQVGGFDADSFFLYCDDVDYSWRVRLAGFRVMYQPAAFVFHDKRLSHDARWLPSSAERYYSAEAALMLAYKWSREDLVSQILRSFERSGDENHSKAAAAFERRKARNRLPAQVDPEHRVGQFIDGLYAKHRFAL